MPLTNTTARFGTVTKVLHWLTALLIFTLIPLGILASDAPFQTGEELAHKAFLFSLHKTLGITLFAVALIRILWALSQTRPGLLNGDNRAESFLAELVHWLLYASLVMVPLAGWISHAASEGFAPIWWPLGQSLPLVPKDPALSHVFATLHFLFVRVLIVSLALHVAGALKHHFIDRDATLRRMWFATPALPAVSAHRRSLAPPAVAALIYAGALGVAAALGLFPDRAEATRSAGLGQVESAWAVQDGTLSISIIQFGSDVRGVFSDWTAAIDYDPESGAGTVSVEIAIGSLTIGSVSDQAMGADYFNADAHPTARFDGTISRTDGTHQASGTVTIKGVETPLSFPFALELEGETARMTGQTSLDRRAFGIGDAVGDEATLGFTVPVDIALTATRTN